MQNKKIMISILLIGAVFFLSIGIVINFKFSSFTWEMNETKILDVQLGFANKPFSEMHESGYMDFRINSLGFRGKEIDNSKPSIVLLGSSMVFGDGVSDPDTLAVQLENQLAGRKSPMNVINAGVIGYGLDQKYKLLKTRILERTPPPDYIVWFLSPIDFSVNSTIIVDLYDINPVDGSLIERDVTKSIFYRSTSIAMWLNQHYNVWFTGFLYTLINRWNNQNELAIEKKYGVLKFEKIMGLVQDLSRKTKIPIYVVVLPDRYHKVNWAFTKNRVQLPFYDLNNEPNLRKNWDKLFLENNLHLSGFGNAEVSAVLINLLFKNTKI